MKTLPPDGTVLEELISNMQDEYGTPATPQEYRLQIRVLPEEEGAPATVVAESVDPESKDQRRGRRSRRRGRRRRGTSAPAAAEDTAPAEDVSYVEDSSEEIDPGPESDKK